ncbi:MAG: Pvc16 family protein, partial [Hungatella hathewayi]
PYTLHYMIFVNGSSQSGMKNQDMLKVVGRAAQVVNDMESVLPNTLQPWLEQGEPPVTLFPARLKLEDKVRVWQAVDKPYGLSLFYRASPVFLSSKIALEVPRVREASFTLLPPEEGGRGS